MKLIWLGLTLLSVALRLALGARLLRGRSFYSFPVFTTYLAASSVGSLLQNSSLWGFWGDAMMAIASLAFSVEIVYLSVFTVPNSATRSYDRAFSFCIGLMVFAVALFASPEPYPGYPTFPYYLRLYTTVGCFAMIVGAATYRWAQRIFSPKWIVAHNLAAIPWLGVSAWSGLVHNTGGARWATRLIGVSVQLGCLLAWHFTIGRGSRAVSSRLPPRGRPCLASSGALDHRGAAQTRA